MSPYFGEDRTTSLAEAAAQLDEVLRHSVEMHEVPGIVAMAAKVIYEGAFGARQLGGAEPMTLDMLFRLQPVTKAVTSVAAMQLVLCGCNPPLLTKKADCIRITLASRRRASETIEVRRALPGPGLYEKSGSRGLAGRDAVGRGRGAALRMGGELCLTLIA